MTTTTRSRFTKADIEFHYDHGRSRPAVNVKVHNAWVGEFAKLLPQVSEDIDGKANPHFNEEWLERHVSEDAWQDYFYSACEDGWELLQMDAEEVFGRGVKVYSEGRQGGWAVVEGIDTDVESWDAIAVARWGKFARWARAQADDVPYQMVRHAYINKFRPWVEA